MKRYIKSSKMLYGDVPEAVVDQLARYRKHVEVGEEHKVFNMLHAYLQGLEDAGMITASDHDRIFADIMDID